MARLFGRNTITSSYKLNVLLDITSNLNQIYTNRVVMETLIETYCSLNQSHDFYV